ncbi:hypothetical protein MNJPNG_25135 [Cupriavidus oxalaticus]|uniref:hypothetical protein n=1 Tax=Cupriavidus oxalaticus TaxID=96344 RepID=UPI003F73CC0F
MSHPNRTPSIRIQYAPAADYCRLTQEEEAHLIVDDWPPRLRNERGTEPICHHVVNVGLFFDGTNNNMGRDDKALAATSRKLTTP